jgi:hypothetical protein
MTPPTTLLFVTLMLNTAAEAASSPTKSPLPAVCQYVSVAASRVIVDWDLTSDANEFYLRFRLQNNSLHRTHRYCQYPSLYPHLQI